MEKKCCLIRNLNLSEMQCEWSVRTKEKCSSKHANFPSRQTNININLWVVVVEGSILMFWAGVCNVTQEPLPFTTPCSAAILLPCYFEICVQQ